MFSKSYCLDDSRRHLENHWFSAALVGVKKAYRRFDPRAFNRDFGIASGILFAKPKFFSGCNNPLRLRIFVRHLRVMLKKKVISTNLSIVRLLSMRLSKSMGKRLVARLPKSLVVCAIFHYILGHVKDPYYSLPRY